MSNKGTDTHQIASVTSHAQLEDHEVDIQAITSNPLSLGEVGTTLTNAQKDFVLRRLHFDALESFDELPPQATFIFEKIKQMSTEKTVRILKEDVKEHNDDMNILGDDLELWKR
ncbi:hypothetical protein CANMA_004004 [Candida margitis]|uniref:uncharacterized protein n=1 Tax=Candida margitis TaxID=1775924 RepID=UPI0022274A49|nr:uncharacterized protein CANMA_004004 [Candida margitis]KAI5960469.1 hypothetical protein CANMA_004004 [Candida margitis]